MGLSHLYVLLRNIRFANLPFKELHPSTWLHSSFVQLHFCTHPDPKYGKGHVNRHFCP